jgi:site-specific recombinase XerD
LPSIKQKINDFIVERRKYTSKEVDNPLFINKDGRRVKDSLFRRFFNRLLTQLQIKENCSIDGRKPVIHSLRHTFAVKSILNWLKSGENMDALPYLSTYMGHISLSSTQIYLQSIKEMTNIGSEKFHHFFQNNI